MWPCWLRKSRSLIATAVVGCCALMLGRGAVAAEPGAEAAPRVSPVPDAAAQAKAEKMIREVFAADLAKGDEDTRRALARKLLRQSKDAWDDPASEYVLLRLARDKALEAYDFATVNKAVDALVRRFGGETADLKLAALKRVTIPLDRSDALATLTDAYLKVAEEALVKGDVPGATRAGAQAEGFRAGGQEPVAGQARSGGQR